MFSDYLNTEYELFDRYGRELVRVIYGSRYGFNRGIIGLEL
jgi:hypothetical protein